MNRNPLIAFCCCFLPLTCVFPQKPVVCETSPQWEAGKYNRVNITVRFPSSSGFARFTQEMPEGIDIVPEAVSQGDFSYNGRQLNVVWLSVPAEGVASFSYLASPDRTMNGTFSLGGKLIQITGGKYRHDYYMDSLAVKVTGTAGNAAVEKPLKPTGEISAQEQADASRAGSVTQGGEQQVEFRIQIAVSSKPLTPAQVSEKLGLKADEPVKTVRSGNIYKYQAGSFTSYSDALAALKKYNASGFKDAFIVAWKGDKQVPVDDNLKKRQP